MLNASAISTRGLVFVLFHMLEVSKTTEKTEFAAAYLKKMSHSSLLMMHQCDGARAYLRDGRTLVFDASGICNFESCLEGTHRSISSSLQLAWDEMKSDHHVASSFTAASFLDITFFLGKVRKFRRSKKKHCWSEGVTNLWYLLRWSVVNLIAACLQHQARHLIQTVDDLESRTIPSRKKRTKKRARQMDEDVAGMAMVAADESGDENVDAAPEDSGRQRQWVQMNLDEIWNLYCDSIEIKGLSLQQIAATKARSREGGVKESTVVNWLGKIQAMYKQRSCMDFSDESHFNLISDASRHSTRDTLVSAVFSPHRGVACYATSQVVKTGKTYPGEIQCEQAVEKLIAQKKADRQSTYRVCQALSNQLSNISGGQKSLASFVCDDPALAPLTAKILHICNGSGITLVYKETERHVPVDLDFLESAPCLVLGMDQGSSGMAAAGFLHNILHAQFYYDPFHRLARDMKLAVSHTPIGVKQRLQLAQLCSTYLWGLSYKPFKQGSFFQDKQELLERFLQSESQDFGGQLLPNTMFELTSFVNCDQHLFLFLETIGRTVQSSRNLQA